MRVSQGRSICAIASEGVAPEWVQLFPRGPDISAVDGRKWKFSDPEALVQAFNGDPNDLPIDYEHATEIKAPRGDPAPAVGWIKELEVRDGEVWAHVEWTVKGAESVSSKEYRYISPTFLADKKTGEIKKLLNAGLTNTPALRMHELAREDRSVQLELAAVWSTAYVNDLPDSAFLFVGKGGDKDEEGKTVPRSLRHFPYRDEAGAIDLPHLRNAIARIPQADIPGLDMQALQKKAQALLAENNNAASAARSPDMQRLAELLGLDPAASEDAVAEKIKVLIGAKAEADKQIEAARAQVPALDKFVPRADYDVEKARAEKAEAAIVERDAAELKKDVDAAIDAALKAGKITPPTVDYHRAQCSTREGLERFHAFAKIAAEIAPDKVVPEKVPDAKPAISAEMLEMAERCGVSREALEAHIKAQA